MSNSPTSEISAPVISSPISPPLPVVGINTTLYGDNSTMHLSPLQKIGNYFYNIYFTCYGYYFPGFLGSFALLYTICMLVLYTGNEETKSVTISDKNIKIFKWLVITLLFLILLIIIIFSVLFYKTESNKENSPFFFESTSEFKKFINRYVLLFGCGSIIIYIIFVSVYAIKYEK
jgi:NADH:ubiquinone oxidoreductase subunit 6 (subunit J)